MNDTLGILALTVLLLGWFVWVVYDAARTAGVKPWYKILR